MQFDFTELLRPLSPVLAFLFLLAVALYFLYREYRLGRKELIAELSAHVSRTVTSEIAKRSEDFTKQLEQVGTALNRIKELQEQVEGRSDAFTSWIQEKEENISRTFADFQSRVERLYRTLPVEEEKAKAPTQDLVSAAREAKTWPEAVPYLEKIKHDDEARSVDLEIAGDIARKHGKLKFASDLYYKAVDVDPENHRAEVELLGVLARIDQPQRDEHLRNAREIVLREMDAQVLMPLSNALIDLDRYAELRDVCEAVLANVTEQTPAALVCQAERDLAVALSKLGAPEAEVERHSQAAFRANPEDENLIKAMAIFYREAGRHDKELEMVVRLLQMDPLDYMYYIYLGRVLESRGEVERAVEWYGRALALTPPGAAQTEVKLAMAKAMQRMEIEDELNALLKEVEEETVEAEAG